MVCLWDFQNLSVHLHSNYGTTKTCRIGRGSGHSLVYSLLSRKEQELYAEALKAVENAVRQYRINDCVPTKIMSDFERTIYKRMHEMIPTVLVSGCFFTLVKVCTARCRRWDCECNTMM